MVRSEKPHINLRSVWACLVIYFICTAVAAASDVSIKELPSKVMVYGANLTESMRATVDKLVISAGRNPKDAQAVLWVTNDEEHQALRGKVPDSVIGTKALSSVYVERSEAGSGIEVTVKNITVMTPDMYRSALATGGVTDARIVAAAPVPVSGTAALTGVFKAYEALTGAKLSSEAKDVAQSELAETNELRKQIGPSEATKFINEIKEQVIRDKITDPKQIRALIIKVSVRYTKLKLTDEQLNRLVMLFQRMAKLPLTIERLSEQLRGILNWDTVNKIVGKVKSVFGR